MMMPPGWKFSLDDDLTAVFWIGIVIGLFALVSEMVVVFGQ